MSTFNDLQVGDRFTSPSRLVSVADLDAIVAVGGYTHPLFTDPEFLKSSPFPSRPMPGQGALLLMGGLVEQTDRFDHTTVGLLAFDLVEFRTPVVAGDDVHVEVEVLEKMPPTSWFSIMKMRWTLHNNRGNRAVVVEARMGFRVTE
jgi:acyl dehydratase